MAASSQRRSTELSLGDVRADISRGMVGIYKDAYGKGPTKAHTRVLGDIVVCILEGGFIEAEKTLKQAGRGDAVVLNREAFQETFRSRFIEVVEEAVGRRVVSFISGVDLETETSAEVFVLESASVKTGEERDAVRGVGRADTPGDGASLN